MARVSKKRDVPAPEGLVVTYVRLRADDHAELKRREEMTGAPIAAQIRILVHDALRAQKTRMIR